MRQRQKRGGCSPPEVGYVWQISAIERAIHRLPMKLGTIPQITAVGPPDGSATDREAAMAVHLRSKGGPTCQLWFGHCAAQLSFHYLRVEDSIRQSTASESHEWGVELSALGLSVLICRTAVRRSEAPPRLISKVTTAAQPPDGYSRHPLSIPPPSLLEPTTRRERQPHPPVPLGLDLHNREHAKVLPRRHVRLSLLGGRRDGSPSVALLIQGRPVRG